MASISALASLTDIELLELRASVDAEARSRGLRFDIGSIGEKLILDLFRSRADLPLLCEAPRGTKNVDALSRKGERYSIKTLLSARKTGTIYPNAVDPACQLFEHLVIAVLDDDLRLKEVVTFTWSEFCNARSWDARMSAWYVSRSGRAFARGTRIL